MTEWTIADKCVCCGSGNLSSYPASISPFIARLLGHDDVILCHTFLCLDCGVIFLDIRYTDAELAMLYTNYRSPEYVAVRDLYEPGYKEFDKWFNNPVPYMDRIEGLLFPTLDFPISVLDWGGDTGKNAPFRHSRKLLHVYDIGNTPVVKDAVKVDFPDAMKYDLVVCANVLEHAPYPRDVLMDIIKSMDEHSVLYLELPYERIMYIGATNTLQWHEHINFFSKASMVKLLENCGLRMVAAEQAITDIFPGFDICQFLLVCKLVKQ